MVVDQDAVTRVGPWLESVLVGLIDEGLNPILVSPGENALGAGIPERAVGRLTFPPIRWSLMQRWGSRHLLDQLLAEPVQAVLAASGHVVRYAHWLAGELEAPLAAIVSGTDEVLPVGAVSNDLAVAFAASDALAQRLLDRLGPAQSARIETVALGVHLGEQAAGFAEPGRTAGIMAAGHLEFANHFEQFIAAAEQLNERHYDAAYFIVGSGPAEHHLRRMAADRRLTDRLTFVPDLQRMGDIFAGIDILVQPYVSDRLDLRLLEAMAGGVVVLARNGGAIDFVRDGVNGVELTGGDEDALAALLARLLDDPTIGRRIGAQARQFVQDHHLAGVTVQRVVAGLKRIALSQQTIQLP